MRPRKPSTRSAHRHSRGWSLDDRTVVRIRELRAQLKRREPEASVRELDDQLAATSTWCRAVSVWPHDPQRRRFAFASPHRSGEPEV